MNGAAFGGNFLSRRTSFDQINVSQFKSEGGFSWRRDLQRFHRSVGNVLSHLVFVHMN